MMEGKTILFVHGFASSGANGTVRHLRELLPDCRIVAPDLPVAPEEALSLLKDLCGKEAPDLIIGTSMGGMFAEQLSGYDRILVNPAFHLADTLLKNNGLGRQEFHSPRSGGETSFMVTKALLEEYRTVSARCFTGEPETGRVWGLFGIHDTMVDCFDEFYAHYPQEIRFDGEHYLNDHAIQSGLLPLIRRIDDRQEARSRKVVLISMDHVLRDTRNGEPLGEAVKAFRHLSEAYETYVYCRERYNEPDRWGDDVRWAERYLGVYAWDRVLAGNRPGLLLGDYWIAPQDEEDFMGTVMVFGMEPFRNWNEVMTFFDRLGGQ